MDVAEADPRGCLPGSPSRTGCSTRQSSSANNAAGAPLAVHEAKLLIDHGVDAPLDMAWTLEQRVLSAPVRHRARDGIEAFADKRDPRRSGAANRVVP